MDGPTNRHTHRQTKPFKDLLLATKKQEMVNETMTEKGENCFKNIIKQKINKILFKKTKTKLEKNRFLK